MGFEGNNPSKSTGLIQRVSTFSFKKAASIQQESLRPQANRPRLTIPDQRDDPESFLSLTPTPTSPMEASISSSKSPAHLTPVNPPKLKPPPLALHSSNLFAPNHDLFQDSPRVVHSPSTFKSFTTTPTSPSFSVPQLSPSVLLTASTSTTSPPSSASILRGSRRWARGLGPPISPPPQAPLPPAPELIYLPDSKSSSLSTTSLNRYRPSLGSSYHRQSSEQASFLILEDSGSEDNDHVFVVKSEAAEFVAASHLLQYTPSEEEPLALPVPSELAGFPLESNRRPAVAASEIGSQVSLVQELPISNHPSIFSEPPILPPRSSLRGSATPNSMHDRKSKHNIHVPPTHSPPVSKSPTLPFGDEYAQSVFYVFESESDSDSEPFNLGEVTEPLGQYRSSLGSTSALDLVEAQVKVRKTPVRQLRRGQLKGPERRLEYTKTQGSTASPAIMRALARARRRNAKERARIRKLVGKLEAGIEAVEFASSAAHVRVSTDRPLRELPTPSRLTPDDNQPESSTIFTSQSTNTLPTPDNRAHTRDVIMPRSSSASICSAATSMKSVTSASAHVLEDQRNAVRFPATDPWNGAGLDFSLPSVLKPGVPTSSGGSGASFYTAHSGSRAVVHSADNLGHDLEISHSKSPQDAVNDGSGEDDGHDGDRLGYGDVGSKHGEGEDEDDADDDDDDDDDEEGVLVTLTSPPTILRGFSIGQGFGVRVAHASASMVALASTSLSPVKPAQSSNSASVDEGSRGGGESGDTRQGLVSPIAGAAARSEPLLTLNPTSDQDTSHAYTITTETREANDAEPGSSTARASRSLRLRNLFTRRPSRTQQQPAAPQLLPPIPAPRVHPAREEQLREQPRSLGVASAVVFREDVFGVQSGRAVPLSSPFPSDPVSGVPSYHIRSTYPMPRDQGTGDAASGTRWLPNETRRLDTSVPPHPSPFPASASALGPLSLSPPASIADLRSKSTPDATASPPEIQPTPPTLPHAPASEPFTLSSHTSMSITSLRSASNSGTPTSPPEIQRSPLSLASRFFSLGKRRGSAPNSTSGQGEEQDFAQPPWVGRRPSAHDMMETAPMYSALPPVGGSLVAVNPAFVLGQAGSG